MTRQELEEKLNQPSDCSKSFNRLYNLTKILRSENGCPWDKDQTPLSNRRNLMEEVFEALDAITSEDAAHAKEELGDVIFNALLTAVMYEDSKDFTAEAMLDEITEKLVRRHPHVFGEASTGNAENKGPSENTAQVMDMWERIKENVEGRKSGSVLDQVPADFPPLLKSCKLLSKAAKKGFEWKSADDAVSKVKEELNEATEAASEISGDIKKALTLSEGSSEKTESFLHLEEELGDLLLSTVNLCRMYGVDPCIALDRADRKFYRRFTYVERNMEQSGLSMDSSHVSEMEQLWKQAKNQE